MADLIWLSVLGMIIKRLLSADRYLYNSVVDSFLAMYAKLATERKLI